MEDNTTSGVFLCMLAVALLIWALISAFDIAEKKKPPEVSMTTDTYYEKVRKFSITTRLEGGCNYVVVISIDGVAVTQALNQPETCKR